MTLDTPPGWPIYHVLLLQTGQSWSPTGKLAPISIWATQILQYAASHWTESRQAAFNSLSFPKRLLKLAFRFYRLRINMKAHVQSPALTGALCVATVAARLKGRAAES